MKAPLSGQHHLKLLKALQAVRGTGQKPMIEKLVHRQW